MAGKAQKNATSKARPAGDSGQVQLSKEEYEGLLATIEFQRDVAKGLADVAAGRTEPWDKVRDELIERLDAAQKAPRKKAKRA
jgi:hypothetical protein